MNRPFYTRSRSYQTRNRHELGLAAEALRERVHFSKISGDIDLSFAADLLRGIGVSLNEFAEALAKECGYSASDIDPHEDFYEAAHQIACRFDERRQEQRIAEESDERTDRGCHQYHHARGE